MVSERSCTIENILCDSFYVHLHVRSWEGEARRDPRGLLGSCHIQFLDLRASYMGVLSLYHWAAYLGFVHFLIFVMLQWKDFFFLRRMKQGEREKKIQSLHQKSKNMDERGLAKGWCLLSWVEIQVVPYSVLFTFRFEHFQKKKQCPTHTHNTHTHSNGFLEPTSLQVNSSPGL